MGVGEERNFSWVTCSREWNVKTLRFEPKSSWEEDLNPPEIPMIRGARATQPPLSSLQDCEDPNPLIRALAVRTMGCIRVDKITEYLCEPLRKCLKDEDPYVRKTAAVCVAKLHDINAQLVEDQGFLDTLKDLISDSNPMVIVFCLLRLPFVRVAVTALPSCSPPALFLPDSLPAPLFGVNKPLSGNSCFSGPQAMFPAP